MKNDKTSRYTLYYKVIMHEVCLHGFVKNWISQGKRLADNVLVCSGKMHTEEICSGKCLTEFLCSGGRQRSECFFTQCSCLIHHQ